MRAARQLLFLLCFVAATNAASVVASPVQGDEQPEYRNWCGVNEVLEFAGAKEAQHYVSRKQNSGQKFVIVGNVVFELRPEASDKPRITEQTSRRQQRVPRPKYLEPRRLNKRDELYSVDLSSHGAHAPWLSGLTGQSELRANEAVWEHLRVIAPTRNIPFTRRPRVAVLDTGIFNHTEFGPSSLRWYVPPQIVPGESNTTGCSVQTHPAPAFSEHATWVAGLIAAADDGIGMSGLGEVKELMSIPVIEVTRGCFSRRQLVAAFACARQQDADIVNISMQSELDRAYPDDLERVITDLAKFSLPSPLVIVAAGNKECEKLPACNTWPAGMNQPNIITVEALDLNHDRLKVSNTGPIIDLSVPVPADSSLCTTAWQDRDSRTVPHCNNGYLRFGQTSAAAALATGAATRVWGHPNFDRCKSDQIRRVMRGFGSSPMRNSPYSCLMQLDFLYEVRRDNDGNAINLCQCPEIASDAVDVQCGSLRSKTFCSTGLLADMP